MAINTAKYENAILRLIQDLGGQIRGKKKLAKLLYFVDFDFFEKYEESITGANYRRLPMGPVPDDMETIIDKLSKTERLSIGEEQERVDYNPTVVYNIKGDCNENVFSDEEIKMIDRVADIYGKLSGKQLEDLTHVEAPYIGTKEGDVILYELAFYRGTDVAT